MNEQEREEIIRRFIDAFNRMDVEAMAAELTEDVEFTGIGEDVFDESVLCDRESFKAQEERNLSVLLHREAFITRLTHLQEDTHVETAELIVPLYNMPGGIKAGVSLTFSNYVIYSFANGRINSIISSSLSL